MKDEPKPIERTERALGDFVVLPTFNGGLAISWPAWGVSFELTPAERDLVKAVA